MTYRILVSSTSMYRFLLFAVDGQWECTENVIRSGGHELIVSPVSPAQADFTIEISMKQLTRMRAVFGQFDEQPVSLAFDTDHNWVWIKEAAFV